MIVYLANGTYVSTQADAKKLSRDWRSVEVPTSEGREALCDWLNANRDPKPTLVEMIDQGPVELKMTGIAPFTGFHGDAPDAAKIETVPFHTQTLDIIHVEEYINKADHRALAAILNSATYRLGDLRRAGGMA